MSKPPVLPVLAPPDRHAASSTSSSRSTSAPKANPKANRRLSSEVDADDVLTDAVNALGLRSRLFCRSELTAPWALAVSAGDYAHFHIVDRGRAWLQVPGTRAPVALAAGDLVVLPGGGGHVLSDGDASEPIRLDRVAKARRPGRVALIRNGGAGADAHVICGAFEFRRREGTSLLLQLPQVLHLKGRDGQPLAWLDCATRLLMLEAQAPRPGQSAVLTRLTDVVLIHVLRHWIATSPRRKGWLVALKDERIGAVLALFHRELRRPWSVDALAREVGMSRSALAARFKALIGEPPLTYLTRWRVLRATQLLRDTDLSIAEIAARVGYATTAAFHKTFKREMRRTPAAYRRPESG